MYITEVKAISRKPVADLLQSELPATPSADNECDLLKCSSVAFQKETSIPGHSFPPELQVFALRACGCEWSGLIHFKFGMEMFTLCSTSNWFPVDTEADILIIRVDSSPRLSVWLQFD